jgi:hypothetical protein
MTTTTRPAFIGHGERGTLFARQALRAAAASTSFRAVIGGVTYCSAVEQFDIVRTETLPSVA